MKRLRASGRRVAGAVCANAVIVGLLSLAWLLLRSGRKPSRINYPCQRTALANTAVLLAGFSVPLAARLPWLRPASRDAAHHRRYAGMRARTRRAAAVAACALVACVALGPPEGGGGRRFEEMRGAAGSLVLPELRSAAADPSEIFVAENIGPSSEHGVDTLIDTMDANGLDFFRGGPTGGAAGPEGIVGGNDVVLIKVNGEWRWRGGTNTDVVKGLVNAVVNHPDGFTGEVVIVENGQWDSYMDNRPDNRNHSECNAQDVTQSFNDVALMFAGRHRVSVYDWTAVQRDAVGEFAAGDARDGYVYVPEIEVGYPKFTTVYGTRISLRDGVWDGSRYDNERLKLINVPVLKDHARTGVTCSIKHFMGVQDLYRMTQEPPHDPMVEEGFLGGLMLTARYPDLNIADAIWVTPAGGPNAPYERAVRTDRLLAGRDPVALDYYCGKYVLLPVSGDRRHDPQNTDGGSNAFRRMLESTRGVLEAGGKRVTTDEGRMTVFKGVPPESLPHADYEYWLAEGCTAYGFETWVLVANPGEAPARVRLSYLTEAGVRNSEPVTVPPRSRLTVNAASGAWAHSAGVRVGSDVPVYVERAMYWGDRVEGHDSTGAPSGSTRWYFAEGCTDHGFETWVAVLNPGPFEAAARLTYLTAGGPVPGPAVNVAPFSRSTVPVNDTAPRGDAGVAVESNRPVVVERSMYWEGRRGGSCSIGATSGSEEWYFAEGATHSGFESYLLLANPSDGTAKVELELSASPPGGAAGGRAKVKSLEMSVPPMARRTVRLNDDAPGSDVAARVRSNRGIVAERSMYWAGGAAGRAGHSSPGVRAPATETFMPEGCTAHGFETWLLVYNPGGADADVEVNVMADNGESGACAVTAPAGGRATVLMNDHRTGSFSLRVLSDRPVACERAVYWRGRSGGTCSPGYFE